MNSLLEKIRRSLRYFYYKYINNWHFPPNVAHLTGGKMAMGNYESEICGMIKENLKGGDIFIDIGANVGYFSRSASGMVGESGHVYAFEPEHSNYHALCNNIAHLKNVTPFHFAVSNEHALVNFFESSHSTSHSIFNTSKNLNGSQFLVPSMTLDHFWINYLDQTDINLIKIDVEGAELLVLEGMKEMLSGNKVEAIILEFHPEIIGKEEKVTELLFSILSRYFSIFYIGKKNDDSTEIKTVKEFNRLSNQGCNKNESANFTLYCKRK